LEDSIDSFLLALRDVTDSQHGFSNLAEIANLNRENLYRMLSTDGNPTVRNLVAVLKALDLRLSIEQICPPTRGSAVPQETLTNKPQPTISKGIATALGLTKTNVRNIEESTMWQRWGHAASAQSTVRQELKERAKKPIAAAAAADSDSEGMQACR